MLLSLKGGSKKIKSNVSSKYVKSIFVKSLINTKDFFPKLRFTIFFLRYLLLVNNFQQMLLILPL